MKRKMILGLLMAVTVTLPAALFAQNKLTAGAVIGGANSHWGFSTPQDDDEDFDWASAWGLYLAIPLGYSINDHFVLQGEIVWTQKGSTLQYEDFENEVHTKAKAKTLLNYFDVPLMLKVSTKPGKVQGFACGGAYLGLATSGKIRATVTVTQQGESESESLTENIDFDEMNVRRSDSGLLFGGGLRFGKVFFEVRYLHGLTNIDTGGDPDAALYNRATVFSIGTFF